MCNWTTTSFQGEKGVLWPKGMKNSTSGAKSGNDWIVPATRVFFDPAAPELVGTEVLCTPARF